MRKTITMLGLLIGLGCDGGLWLDAEDPGFTPTTDATDPPSACDAERCASACAAHRFPLSECTVGDGETICLCSSGTPCSPMTCRFHCHTHDAVGGFCAGDSCTCELPL
jgi:hypothetical protein